jgi:hypothetical protein
MTNFAKVFNEVFVRERPALLARYSLTQVCIAELESRDQNFHLPFTYNFCNGTTRELNYHHSWRFLTMLRNICVFLKARDRAEGRDYSEHL